jgi:hypothetical protein
MSAPDSYDKVRAICLGFPGADEKLSYGAPSFHVKGRLFASYDEDSYGEGFPSVLVKSTLAEQKKLVARAPARFYVPRYVGVKGWVGVRLDGKPDWVELAILAEEGYRAVAPPSVQRSGKVTPASARPPVARVTTDPKVAAAAREKLTAICLTLPEAECERDSRHATYRVKKKVFAYFLDNHHGDGIVAACVKGDRRQNAQLVRDDPKRFYAPAYIAARGYVGVRLDGKRVDWDDVATRVRASYELCFPASRARKGRRV